jgi:hypothetical protein
MTPSSEERPIPLVVAYYTIDTPYEELARMFRLNLDRMGMDHDVRGLPDTGRWVTNCALKGPFMRDMMKELDRPLVWIDIDAEVLRRPTILAEQAGGEYDMALYFKQRQRGGEGKRARRAGGTGIRTELISSCMLFNPTDMTKKVLADWAERCRVDGHRWDQKLLHESVNKLGPKIYDLPPHYCVLYRPGRKTGWSPTGGEKPVIRQFQCSRAAKGRKGAMPEMKKVFGYGEDEEGRKAFKANRRFKKGRKKGPAA